MQIPEVPSRDDVTGSGDKDELRYSYTLSPNKLSVKSNCFLFYY
jgi:hypothetical protein